MLNENEMRAETVFITATHQAHITLQELHRGRGHALWVVSEDENILTGAVCWLLPVNPDEGGLGWIAASLLSWIRSHRLQMNSGWRM